MIILLTGGCKNGKSSLAQKLSVFLSKRKSGRLYYVATMKSTGEEDDERIRKHVEDRKGLGFTTIEIQEKIHTLPMKAEKIDTRPKETEKNACRANGAETVESESARTYLIDSITALLANEMFREKELAERSSDGGEGGSDMAEFYIDREAPERVAGDVGRLIESAKGCGDASGRIKDGSEVSTPAKGQGVDLIFVSDGIYSDAAVYDGDTYLYRKGLGRLEREISDAADLVIEMCAGVPIIHSVSAEAAGDVELMNMMKRDVNAQETADAASRGALIVGGASQGKRAFAKEKFGLKDEDIYTFKRDDEAIPVGYKAYEHIERLVWEGRHSIYELSDVLPKDAVLICEDITCGIVPMNREDRRWRDDVGRLMQALGAERQIYRVICGKGNKIG
ncbi:MAG: bifunctional adenosylcobinamide kinase/adenosylcobinamide-phosphate guanylyltransferase [Butyrivibrio sp.]|nr:bifunctional adenosylcobinamide kinase/adenosylcobinamide-phosphate guanylyltransferase [Butyrivibrio sp.]